MNTKFIEKYAPYLYFDEHEPFFPVRIGVTIFDESGRSPSMERDIVFDKAVVQNVIEFAIYWDFDIGHLYELEHVWIYVGQDGSVYDCEASFHGGYFKGLLKNRSNMEDGTHVKLYSQPGKHAFSPMIEILELIPQLYLATEEMAGNAGLIVTPAFEGVYETSSEINKKVESYLKRFAFRPSMSFDHYLIPPELYCTWNELFVEIPGRIQARLAEM